MAYVDTNVILRWLLNDDAALAARAEAVFDGAKDHSLMVTDVVMAEVTYVLRSLRYTREQVVAAFDMLQLTSVLAIEHESELAEAMTLMLSTKLDFADCYLIARARHDGTGLETFDADMERRFKSPNN